MLTARCAGPSDGNSARVRRGRYLANPVNRVLLSSRLWTLVPVAHAKSPTTGASWEGTGVTPDIRSAADQALAAAQKDAARQLIGQHKDDPLTREQEALLAAK